MRFEWDPVKAELNLAKHGVAFDEALSAFADPLAAILDDEHHAVRENRQILVGFSAIGRLLVVSFVERRDNHLRLISARLATRREKKNHEAHLGH